MLLVLTLATLFFVYPGGSDIPKGIPKDSNAKVEYRSERAFGNDAFDIYSFSVDGELGNNEFVKMDARYQEMSEDFKGMIETEYSEPNDSADKLKEIRQNMDLIEEDGLYMYINYEDKGKAELYIYSKRLNKGYCFISII